MVTVRHNGQLLEACTSFESGIPYKKCESTTRLWNMREYLDTGFDDDYTCRED